MNVSYCFFLYASALIISLFIFIDVFFIFSFYLHSTMTSKLAPLSTSLIIQRRPLTNVALDNKIRAILSQFHPYERYFAIALHENTFDRIYTYIKPINSMRDEYLKSKLPFSIINSSMMIKDKTKIDDFSLLNKQTVEYIYTHEKVTEWLKHLNYNHKNKEINII
jgi:hypothetical protein